MITPRSLARRKARKLLRRDLYRLVFGPANSSPMNFGKLGNRPETTMRVRDKIETVADFKDLCRYVRTKLPDCDFPPRRQLEIIEAVNKLRPKGARSMHWAVPDEFVVEGEMEDAA